MNSNNIIKMVTILTCCVGVAACASPATLQEARDDSEAPLEKSVSQFSEALACLGGHMDVQPVLTVGAVMDLTGKESYTDGGNGKYITQGARHIAMSAVHATERAILINTADIGLENAIEKKVNKRAVWPRTPDTYVTGSINSLDFIPGSAIEVSAGPASAGYREFGMIIALDMFLTQYGTGEVMTKTTIERRLTGQEVKAGLLDFFGDEIGGADINVKKRAAVHMVVQSMVKGAVYELLSVYANDNAGKECDPMIHGDNQAKMASK